MDRETKNRSLEFYRDKRSKIPFLEWLEALDIKTQARIRHRLIRVEDGNFGDSASVGDGVMELRLFFGPGYRVYLGEVDKTVVLLLLGGDKKTQEKDIQRAKEYWKEFRKTLI